MLITYITMNELTILCHYSGRRMSWISTGKSSAVRLYRAGWTEGGKGQHG